VTTRTVVAATKLTIPTSRRSTVPRPELLARLDGDYRVALVSAPAGYVKTATLAAWAADLGEPMAWLSCDPSDVEPTRFMTCLLSTLSKSWPGVADDAFVLLERGGANSHDAAVAAANELAAVDGRGVIVVDDLHLAAPDPGLLTAFIGALPERFRFVTGTRSDPPLSLARWRLRGDLLELRSDDLRFGDAEVAEFFGLHEMSLSAAELMRLHELTEGWPAGVQLAAIALRRAAGRDGFLDAFARTDRADAVEAGRQQSLI
jgi:LuxR family maltose regulon positive regulatory protein